MATRKAADRPLRAVAWGVALAAFVYGPRNATSETGATIAVLLGAALAAVLWFTRNK